MPYYIAPFIGSGTKKSPYVPAGFTEEMSYIDFRPDCSKLTGFAITYSPVATSDSRLIKLSDLKTDVVSAGVLNTLKNRLDPNLVSGRIDVSIARLLRQPPSNRWKGILPTHEGAYEIHLGGERIYFEPLVGGGATGSDSFTRANETPLAGNWSRTWSSSASTFNLVSNAVVHAAGSADTAYHYDGAVFSNDHYSQAIELGIPENDWGPGVRLSHTLGNSNAYVFDVYDNSTGTPGAGTNMFKLVNGSYTFLSGGITGGYTVGDTIKMEASGSSLKGYKNGVLNAATGTQTDTALTTGKPGIFIYQAGGSGVDNWQGGDLGGTVQRPGFFAFM